MKVRVYTDYAPVRILRGVSKKEFTEPTDALALKCGLEGAFVEVDETEIPSDRTYRAAWEVDGDKVKVNAAKKQEVDDVVAQKEADVLVAEKVRELAVASLQAEGKLTVEGKVSK
jgi:hypothetical protein